MHRAIFVDTSAWVGFFLAKDQHHREAVGVLDELGNAGRPFITTEYILAETVTRLRIQGGLTVADRAWEELEGGELVHLVQVEPVHRHEGRKIFRKYGQLTLSLVDCVSFAVMKEYGLEEAVSFDQDFEKVGFTRLPRRT